MQSTLESLKLLLEIAGLIFLPLVAWLLRTVVVHSRQLVVLEEKVNQQINQRLEKMEQKIDTFDSKIETKIDRLEQNLNAKIDIMTSVLTTCTNSLMAEKKNPNEE